MIFGVQKRLQYILSIQDQAERRDKLSKLARNLGCSFTSTYEGGPEHAKYLEHEVVARIQAAARESRDATLWLLALISALASLASA